MKVPKHPKQLWEMLPATKRDAEETVRFYSGLLVRAQITGDETLPQIVETMMHIQYRCIKLNLYIDAYGPQFISAYEKHLPMMSWTPYDKTQICVEPKSTAPIEISSIDDLDLKDPSVDSGLVEDFDIPSENIEHNNVQDSHCDTTDVPPVHKKRKNRVGKNSYQRKLDRYRQRNDNKVSKDELPVALQQKYHDATQYEQHIEFETVKELKTPQPKHVMPRSDLRVKSRRTRLSEFGTFESYRKRKAFGGFIDVGAKRFDDLLRLSNDPDWSIASNADHNLRYRGLTYLSEGKHSPLALLHMTSGCSIMFGDNFSFVRPPERDDREVIFQIGLR